MTDVQNDTRAILDAIRGIVRGLRIASRASEKACGLSAAQVFVLHQLKGRSGLSLNELADLTMTHQSSVSVVVARLVAANLVKRESSSQDSRKVSLSLTATGKKLINKAPVTAQETLISAVHRLPPKDRARLAASLLDLAKDAGFMDGPPPLLFEDKS